MAITEKWLSEITIEVVPEKYRDIANMIGINNFIKLANAFGGSMVYVPKYDTLTREIRNEKIQKEFNGSNYKELAIKYNLSETHVRSIINSDAVDGQISLF